MKKEQPGISIFKAMQFGFGISLMCTGILIIISAVASAIIRIL